MKLAGVLLILTGAAWIAVRDIRSRRMNLAQVQEMAAALYDMESDIRWKRQTLPTAIERQRKRTLCGTYFKAVLDELDSGHSLMEAWEKAFLPFSPPKAGECIRQVELCGDETHLLSNLHRGADALQEIYREMKRKQSEDEKLRLTLLFSGTGMLIILLL